MFFFFNTTATTEIYPLSLHDALPIERTASARASASSIPVSTSRINGTRSLIPGGRPPRPPRRGRTTIDWLPRSEEHTSELQSRQYIVCRLLLEKKKINSPTVNHYLPL